MAVAHSAASESHTGTTGSTNQAAFSWTHTQTGTPQGVVVFVSTFASVSDFITSVTYGGIALTRLTGGLAQDGAGESGRLDTFFLGSGLSSDNQTITVNRTNNATVMYAAAATVTAGADTAVPTATIVLLEGDGTLAAQSVDDTSPGQNSVRYAGCYSGLNAPPTAGTGSTLLNSIDIGNYGSALVRETTAGQGARSIGFTGATDDRAAVHLAIRELVPRTETPIVGTFTLTGNAAGLLHNVKLDGGTGAFTFTGNPATLTEATPKSITTETGTFALTGNDVTFAVTRNLDAAAGTFALTGPPAALTIQRQLAAGSTAINLLSFTEQLNNAYWTKTRSSISKNLIAAPDGTVTADKLIEDTTANNTHLIARSLSFTSDTTYTLSAYLKAGERQGGAIGFGGAIVDLPAFQQLYVNLTNGNIVSQPSGTTASVESVGNDWYRLRLTIAATVSTSVQIQARVGSSATVATTTYTGDGTSGIYVWGFQLEAASTVGEYRPQPADFDLEGEESTPRHNSKIDGGTGAFTLTGNAATLTKTAADELSALVGTFTLASNGATLARSRLFTAIRGQFTLTGQSASLLQNYRVTGDRGQFLLAGNPAALAVAYTMLGARGAFTFTGNPAGLSDTDRLAAATGIFSLTGLSAGLVKSGGVGRRRNVLIF